jgi:hypothetical protein
VVVEKEKGRGVGGSLVHEARGCFGERRRRRENMVGRSIAVVSTGAGEEGVVETRALHGPYLRRDRGEEVVIAVIVCAA